MSKCYSGRVISIQKKYQLEIKSATIIQTYIRRTIGRLRYVRANWCISIVDFATPKARNSATLIQGLFRGYKLRKMIQEGTLDVIGKMELIEMMMETEDAAQNRAYSCPDRVTVSKKFKSHFPDAPASLARAFAMAITDRTGFGLASHIMIDTYLDTMKNKPEEATESEDK